MRRETLKKRAQVSWKDRQTDGMGAHRAVRSGERVQVDPGGSLTSTLHGSGGPGQVGGALSQGLSD